MPNNTTAAALAALRDAERVGYGELTRADLDRLFALLDEIDTDHAERIASATLRGDDVFRATCSNLASVLVVELLEDGETGDEAGELLDAGVSGRLDVTTLRLPRASERDQLLAAAIPNRATGGTYATTRVRVTHRIPNVGDTPSRTETIDLDVVGISGRVIGFGGAVLTGFRVDGELPVVSIPTSAILAIEPIL